MRQNVKKSVPNISLLVRKGYGAALLEYRGSEEACFPSVILDAKAGIIFMKNNADKYNINPDKIILMGDSSGGYTALMAGLTYQVDSLEDEYSLGKDYSVKGIIDFYGPTDFTSMDEEKSCTIHRNPDSPEGKFVGGIEINPKSEYIQRTIIKNYISDNRKLPPVIMFHGDADEMVPFSQSCQLYEALIKNGHYAELFEVCGANHGGAEFWSDETLEIINDFVKKII